MGASDFSGRLLDGEKIIWTRQPAQGLRLSPRDGFFIPASLLWGGFAIFWESKVLSAPNAPIFMAIWGVPFMLVGLYLIIGRFFVDAWIRRSTNYALTNQRVLILRQKPLGNFITLSLSRLPDMRLKIGRAHV